MSIKLGKVLAIVIGCVTGVSSAAGVGQARGDAPEKNVMLQQNVSPRAIQNGGSTRQQLQARAKKILADEAAREAAGACKDAQTTVDFNECFGKQAATTDGNLKALEDVIAELGDPDPQPQDHPSGTGIAGPVLSPKQHVAEFRKVEQSWRQYQVAACTAAIHQFDGGTGGPSFELECEIKLDRSHMRELEIIFGGDLRL